MKIYMLKNVLAMLVIVLAIPSLQAQFDDVYYDPDQFDPGYNYDYKTEEIPVDSGESGITYYDNDEYDNFEDYDYYYSSRIQRFYHPYIGFGFYDPVYVNYNYYDPYAWDYYAYPAAGIYVNAGLGFGFSFGFGSYWNNWYYPPYYAYGGYYPYYGGCNSYYGYGGYYNPYYYGGCGGGYYGGYDHHHGGYDDHYGDHGDHYYGPRVTGNTGSSPRGPAVPPGVVSPVKDRDTYVKESNDRPIGTPQEGIPGRSTDSGPIVSGGTEQTPGAPPVTRSGDAPDVVKQIPVDRELPRDVPSAPTTRRPVFKPYTENFQPYPSSGRSQPVTDEPVADNRPSYRPYTPQNKPSTPPKENYRSNPQAERPDHSPSPAGQSPSYTPPKRENQVRPSYTPPPARSNDRPTQTQPSRSNDKPSYSPPPRRKDESASSDRPSYSPPPRSDSNKSSNSPSSHSPASSGRDSSPSGGNRSSGSSQSSGGSHGSSSSPRGKG